MMWATKELAQSHVVGAAPRYAHVRPLYLQVIGSRGAARGKRVSVRGVDPAKRTPLMLHLVRWYTDAVMASGDELSGRGPLPYLVVSVLPPRGRQQHERYQPGLLGARRSIASRCASGVGWLHPTDRRSHGRCVPPNRRDLARARPRYPQAPLRPRLGGPGVESLGGEAPPAVLRPPL